MHLRGKINIILFQCVNVQLHIRIFDFVQISNSDVFRAERIGLHRRDNFLFLFLLTSPTDDTWRAYLRDQIMPARNWIKDRLDITNLSRMEKALVFGVVTLLCYAYVTRPLRFGLAVGAFMLASAYYDVPGRDEVQVLCQKRSFFGVLKIEHERYQMGEDAFAFRRLVHGTTLHGMQFVLPQERRDDQREVPVHLPHRRAVAACARLSRCDARCSCC